MGLFSSKVKKIKGISFVPIVQDTREEYVQFRKELLMAMIGNFSIKRFAFELWKYKQNVKHRYKTAKLDEVAGGIQTKTISKKDWSYVYNYLENNNITGVVRVLSGTDRQRVCIYDTTDKPEGTHLINLAISSWNHNTPQFAPYNVEIGTEGEYDRYEPYAEYTNNFIVTDNGVTGSVYITCEYDVKATVYQYRYDNNCNLVLVDTLYGVVLEESLYIDLYYEDSAHQVLVKDYFYGKLKCLGTDNDHALLPIIEVHSDVYISEYINSTPTIINSTFNIAPMLQVKGLNSTLTPEDQAVMRQLKKFGIGIDSIQNMLDNDIIKDFKVGLMVSPHDALTSRAIAKYLFHFFDSLGIPETEDYSDVFIRGRDGFSFEQEVSNSTYITNFSITKSIKSGTIPNANQKTYRLKCRQNIPNSQRFYKHIKEVYDDAIGNDPNNTKTTKQLYDEIIQALENDPNNQTLIDARYELPAYNATSEMKPIKYIVVSCAIGEYVVASETERSEAITFGDDDVKTVIWDVIGVKELIDFPDADKYSAVVSEGYEYNEFYEDFLETGNSDGEPLTVFSIELNYQHAPNEYTVITYSNGSIEYTTESGTVTQRHTAEDTDLRIPMIREALQNVTVYEFHELYSKCFIGLAFTVQKIRIKWYQRGIFKVVLQIVLVVVAVAVTVLSGGAGVGVGTALASVATNIAIGYAVTAVVVKILDAAGIDTTWARVAVAVIQVAVTGTITADNMAQLGLVLADTAVKLELQSTQEDMQRLKEQQEEFNKMMDKKMKELKKNLETFKGDIFNLVKMTPEYDEMMLYTPSYAVEITEDLYKIQEDNEWRLPEVQDIDRNLVDNLDYDWRNFVKLSTTINIPRSEVHTFGIGRL